MPVAFGPDGATDTTSNAPQGPPYLPVPPEPARMDRARLLEVAPHYVALVVVMFAALVVMRALFGEISFWIELAVLFVIAFAYRPVVMRLGVAPSAWEERSATED